VIQVNLSKTQLDDLFEGRGWTWYEHQGQVFKITKDDLRFKKSDLDKLKDKLDKQTKEDV